MFFYAGKDNHSPGVFPPNKSLERDLSNNLFRQSGAGKGSNDFQQSRAVRAFTGDEQDCSISVGNSLSRAEKSYKGSHQRRA